MSPSPDLSIVMPCYNEESVVGYTIPKLAVAFAKAGYQLELVAVDNGSHDRTGELLLELAARHPGVAPHRVDVNEGYGNGILQGIAECHAPWIGMIPADGQVDAEDVVRLYEAAVAAGRPVLAKARRRFRMDGLARKVVSIVYNLFVRLLWPGMQSLDVNGTPKLLPREHLLAMNLQSKDWFLDPEIMVKAYYMGLPVLEFNVFGRLRGSGLSHVRAATCWEFFSNLLVFRFSRKWRRGLTAV
jgi:glycosyltransferase involved in cell wall biosynthesis